jgi:type II secretory pathway pseudopilin PulG
VTRDRATDGSSSRLTGDAGTSLIEVLMAVVLVGLAGASILGGMASSVWGTDVHHKQVQIALALTSAAEHLKDPALALVPCATPTTSSYVAAVQAADRPDGWGPDTVQIVDVSYSSGTGFGATCRDTDALGHRLATQLVTLRAASPDGRAADTLVVAKGVSS